MILSVQHLVKVGKDPQQSQTQGGMAICLCTRVGEEE